jgi:Ankyrin repeats (3 copies)/YbbR-like protein/Ankyrin repeat
MAQIHDAADQGDFAEVKRLLAVGVNVNTPAEDGWPPLNIAALQGHSVVAKCLIEQGADIEATSPGGFCPLFVAAQEGHLDTVKLLIKNNAMIDARSNDGGTALYNAALNGHAEVVDFLISAGAEVDALSLNQGSPLAVASQQGHLDVVRLLAREGADIEIANIDGFTSLHMSAQEGHEDVVKFLLEQGADIDSRNHAGSTPDDIASLHGHPKITELIAGKRVQNPGGGVYCTKCGKGVIMSWTCPKCNKLICDTCSGLTTTQPEIHEGFTSQTLGGGTATCPYCDSGSSVTAKTPTSSQKVACTKCGTMIWKSVAKGNGGRCMRCTADGCAITTKSAVTSTMPGYIRAIIAVSIVIGVIVALMLVVSNVKDHATRKVVVKAYFDPKEMPKNLTVDKVNVLPKYVWITGAKSLIQNIESVDTVPVPLEHQTGSFEHTVAIPKNRNYQISPENVMVIVKITKYFASKTFKAIPIKILKNSGELSNMQVELLSTPDVTVMVNGPPGKIEVLKQKMLDPHIDISSLELEKPGKYRVNVDCGVDLKGIKITSVFPSQVTIKLSRGRVSTK